MREGPTAGGAVHACVPDPPLLAGRVARTPRTQFPQFQKPFGTGSDSTLPPRSRSSPAGGGSSAGLCAEHDVLLSVCDIHAYKCTLVRAASKKTAHKRAPGDSAGLPKGAAQPCQTMLCPRGPTSSAGFIGHWQGHGQIFILNPFFSKPGFGKKKKSMRYPGQHWLLCSYPSCS